MSDVIQWASSASVTEADLEGVTAGLALSSLTYWLGRARRAILADFPLALLNARIAEGVVDPQAIQDVQVDLVLGKLANPGGVRTMQESNGPSSGSITYGGDTPGQLTLTAEHRRMLGASGAGRRVARTVDTWR